MTALSPRCSPGKVRSPKNTAGKGCAWNSARIKPPRSHHPRPGGQGEQGAAPRPRDGLGVTQGPVTKGQRCAGTWRRYRGPATQRAGADPSPGAGIAIPGVGIVIPGTGIVTPELESSSQGLELSPGGWNCHPWCWNCHPRAGIVIPGAGIVTPGAGIVIPGLELSPQRLESPSQGVQAVLSPSPLSWVFNRSEGF